MTNQTLHTRAVISPQIPSDLPPDLNDTSHQICHTVEQFGDLGDTCQAQQHAHGLMGAESIKLFNVNR